MARGGVGSLGGSRQTPLFCLLGSTAVLWSITGLRFWTWRICVLIVTVSMHTETMTVRWVKCQKDWYYSGIAVLRSYRFPGDCIGLRLGHLHLWMQCGAAKQAVCSCSPAGAFNQPGECLYLELYSGFLSRILFSWNSTQHSTSPSLAYTWQLSWNGVFFNIFLQ